MAARAKSAKRPKKTKIPLLLNRPFSSPKILTLCLSTKQTRSDLFHHSNNFPFYAVEIKVHFLPESGLAINLIAQVVKRITLSHFMFSLSIAALQFCTIKLTFKTRVFGLQVARYIRGAGMVFPEAFEDGECAGAPARALSVHVSQNSHRAP